MAVGRRAIFYDLENEPIPIEYRNRPERFIEFLGWFFDGVNYSLKNFNVVTQFVTAQTHIFENIAPLVHYFCTGHYYQSSDEKLMDLIEEHVEDHVPIERSVLLISNDGDFADTIYAIRQAGYHTMLIHGPRCSAELLNAAETKYEMGDMVYLARVAMKAGREKTLIIYT